MFPLLNSPDLAWDSLQDSSSDSGKHERFTPADEFNVVLGTVEFSHEKREMVEEKEDNDDEVSTYSSCKDFGHYSGNVDCVDSSEVLSDVNYVDRYSAFFNLIVAIML